MLEDLVELWRPEGREFTLDYNLAPQLQRDYPEFYKLLESTGFAESHRSPSLPVYEYVHSGRYNSFLNFCWDVKAPTDKAVEHFKESYSFDNSTLTKILRYHFQFPKPQNRSFGTQTHVWITLVVGPKVVYDEKFEKADLERFRVNTEIRWEAGACSKSMHQLNVRDVPDTDLLFEFLQKKNTNAPEPVDDQVLKDLVRALKYKPSMNARPLYFYHGEDMKDVTFTITARHSEVTPVDEVLVDEYLLKGWGGRKRGRANREGGEGPPAQRPRIGAAFADLSGTV